MHFTSGIGLVLLIGQAARCAIRKPISYIQSSLPTNILQMLTIDSVQLDLEMEMGMYIVRQSAIYTHMYMRSFVPEAGIKGRDK